MLENLYRPIEKEICEVKSLIKQTLLTNENFQSIATHLIKREGKFVRTAIILLLTKMFNGDMKKSIKIAASCELIHLATLLHDDVIDNSGKRRGIESSNFKFGNKFSILMGDFIHSRAFDLILAVEDGRILNELLEASRLMCEGEAMEIINSGKLDITMDIYLKIIKLKTAVFFEKCSGCSGIVSKKDDEIIESCGEFGKEFGMIFQLTDDMLDFLSSSNKLGKPIMIDLKEKHYTMTLIDALNSEKYKEELIKEISKEENIDEEKILEILKKSNSFDFTRREIDKYIVNIKEILNDFEVENEEARGSIIGIVDYMTKREY
jgi:octaprenyl-diphosphate synthase